ncbi:MAG: carbohydrate ABC transporter permease, partial [Fimbriimonadaceae bacterium]|nr:carbohydrate ABC transporter permease [Fimbriimonadaceae bacterium]
IVLGFLTYLWHLALNEPFDILKGAATFSPWTLIALAALAVGAVMAMVAAERAARSRGLAVKIATTLTLLVGCVVFGFPFLWLLLTSVKEERDFSMTEGIQWIPLVQEQHRFVDPERPLAEAPYRGRTVRARIEERLPDGRLLMEVERPFGLLGRRFEVEPNQIREIPRDAPVIATEHQGQTVQGFVRRELDSGARRMEILRPESLKGTVIEVKPGDDVPVRNPGIRWQNYTEVLEYLPEDVNFGLRYLQNTMVLVILSMIGTIFSCSFVAYGFSRLKFPGRDTLFMVMLATMMLPGAVTMLPSFLIFRNLGWIDTLLPVWVPTFFAGAFNVFLINQFFKTIPMELEDAAKIDGCSYIRTFWQVMLPLIKPALAAISIWTFMGAWNNFMGPLIYISSPENMPLAYAVQLFNSERGGSFGLMMAFGVMASLPVLALFFIAQRWFIEGVQLSGLGGR